MRRLFLTRVKVMNGAGGLWVRKFSALQPPLNASGGLSADLEDSSLWTYLSRGTEELRSREALPEKRLVKGPVPQVHVPPTAHSHITLFPFSLLPSFQMYK